MDYFPTTAVMLRGVFVFVKYKCRRSLNEEEFRSSNANYNGGSTLALNFSQGNWPSSIPYSNYINNQTSTPVIHIQLLFFLLVLVSLTSFKVIAAEAKKF